MVDLPRCKLVVACIVRANGGAIEKTNKYQLQPNATLRVGQLDVYKCCVHTLVSYIYIYELSVYYYM